MTTFNPEHEELVMRFGRQVKGLRKALKLSLQELADRSGLTKSYVWELERGTNTNPTLLVIVSLSRALGCSIDDLVGTETYMKPQLRPEAMRIAVEVDNLLRAALGGRKEG